MTVTDFIERFSNQYRFVKDFANDLVITLYRLFATVSRTEMCAFFTNPKKKQPPPNTEETTVLQKLIVIKKN